MKNAKRAGQCGCRWKSPPMRTTDIHHTYFVKAGKGLKSGDLWFLQKRKRFKYWDWQRLGCMLHSSAYLLTDPYPCSALPDLTVARWGSPRTTNYNMSSCEFSLSVLPAGWASASFLPISKGPEVLTYTLCYSNGNSQVVRARRRKTEGARSLLQMPLLWLQVQIPRFTTYPPQSQAGKEKGGGSASLDDRPK